MGGPGPLRSHTHVGDHPEFLNVGGLCVQKLPHRLLLVALPPSQLLWEGQGSARSRECSGTGRVSNLASNLLFPAETRRSPKFWATKTAKWHTAVSPCLSFPKAG